MDTERTTTGPVILARLLWIMVGPITLSLLALLIAQQRSRWLSPASIAYFAVLSATMLGRWFEFRLGDPMTSTGEPASAAHLRKYILAAAALGLAAWMLANSSAAVRHILLGRG